MTSRLTALGPAIHAFGSVDEAFDALAVSHGELPDDLDLSNVQPSSRLATPGRLASDASRPVDDPQAPPAFSSRSAALADTSTRSEVLR